MADGETHGASVQIRNLFKIFGREGEKYVDAVRAGMTKTELNERHHHVLGLKDISIDMPAGGIQVIMGLSGSGKSTLIRHINRLIDPTVGEVLIDGVDVVKMSSDDLREFRRHQTAMVFQKFALLPHRTVLENTVFGLEIQSVPRERQLEAAMRWIERVGLKGFETRYPNQLSGGMQQRVGLARALANDAPILLMDEAFSALDPLIRVDMQTVLLSLQSEIRKTIVFITHDLDEALRLGDRIAILRDGEVVQQGTSQDIILRPADGYIETFVKEVNRGRFVRVVSAMRPLPGRETGNRPLPGRETGNRPLPGRETDMPPLEGHSAEAGHTIAADATVEDAAQALRTRGVEILTVVDAKGIPLGTIDMTRVLDAILPASARQSDDASQFKGLAPV